MTPWTPPVDLTQVAVPPRVYPSERSPEALLDVVAQLDPARSLRYQRRDVSGDGRPETFCNFFLRDALNALGVKMPKAVANELVRYFNEAETWAPCFAHAAAERASAGFPTVAGWANPTPRLPGHVALVLPTHPGAHGVRIAQAGRVCFNDGELTQGFGGLPVLFWTHD